MSRSSRNGSSGREYGLRSRALWRALRRALWRALLAAAVAILGAVTPGASGAHPAQDRGDGAEQEAVRSPAETIEAQLAAFNAGDIATLAANVAPDFVWIAVDSSGSTVELTGREQFQRSMEGYFAGVYEPRAEIDGMVVSGNFVAVREVAYWQGAEGEMSAASLAVYEVRKGLIHRVWYYPVESGA